MANQQTRRVWVNQSGTALSGANIMGANCTVSAATAVPDVRAHQVNIRAVQGYYPLGTPTVFLMLFANAASVPANGTKPDLCITINPAINRDFVEDLSLAQRTLLTPISWCVSTTQTTKTLDATANDYVNFCIDIEEPEPNPLPDNVSASGDLTVLVDSLQVWTEASNTASTKRLLRVEGRNVNGATDLYLMLFARNSNTPVDGDVPVWCSQKVLLSGAPVVQFNFGNGGLNPKQLISLVEKHGCSLFWSSTSGVLTQPGSTPGSIKAYYQ